VGGDSGGSVVLDGVLRCGIRGVGEVFALFRVKKLSSYSVRLSPCYFRVLCDVDHTAKMQLLSSVICK